MSTAARTTGEYLVELLAANGIDTVFGIPGVHNLELYRGLARTGLRHVLVRHEQGAAFAADGYARASGRPAAAFVISGPGLTNALTAVAQAYSDSVPLLVIASTPAAATRGKGWGALHELPDQGAMAAGATGCARTAQRPRDVADHLRAAFAALRAPRARPAYLGVPLDVLAERTAEPVARFVDPLGAPQPEPAALARAVALLDAAERPLIIAGGGARAAAEPLRQLVEAIDGYLVTTAAGKGVLPESHPASLGAGLPYGPIQQLIGQADVVLAVGTELSDSDIYAPPRLELSGRLIRVDVDRGKLADQYVAELALCGDATLVLRALASGVRPRGGWRASRGEASAHRPDVQRYWGAEALHALRGLRAGLPDEAQVFTDMTQIAYLGAYAYPVEAPGLWHAPIGFGALGYALPAAIGAMLARPDTAIVALAGDFGLQFTIAELMTAVEQQLSLPVVVWNNAALGQIRDDMARAGIAPIAVAARNPDFLRLAEACGARAVRALGPDSLAIAVRDALRARGPTLIEARIEDFGQPPAEQDPSAGRGAARGSRP